MKQLLFAASLLCCGTAFSQTDYAEKYSETITPKALKEKLSVIAGAEMEGRETATPGQKKAAAYIESYFKKIGLQPPTAAGYQLVYPVYQDTLENATLSINGKSFELNKAFAVPASSILGGFWNATNVVFASFGLSDTANNNLDGLDVKDKWVMVIDGTPAEMDRLPGPIVLPIAYWPLENCLNYGPKVLKAYWLLAGVYLLLPSHHAKAICM